jgi:hypothetical protein
MTFTKIINSGTATINLPTAIGGGTLSVGASVTLAYDIQTVGAAMAANNIIHYGMESVEGGSSISILEVSNKLYVDPVLGNDNNNGTQAQPLASIYRAVTLTQLWERDMEIWLTQGVHTITANTRFFFGAGALGGTATPIGFIGVASDQVGTRVSTSGTNSTTANDSTLSSLRSGAGAAVSAVTGSGISKKATITGLTGMTVNDVGKMIKFSGAASSGNNGIFAITDFVSSASVKIYNAQSSVAAGPFNWQDSLRGATIRFIDGYAATSGNERLISDNTLTSFSWLEPMNAAASAGNSFVIERPGTIIQHANPLTFQSPANTWIGFQNIKIEPTDTSPTTAALIFLGVNAFFDRCELNGKSRGLSVFNRAFLNASGLWQNNTTGTFGPAARTPKVFCHDYTISPNDCRFANRWIFNHVFLNHTANAGYSLQLNFSYLDAKRTTIVADADATVQLAADAAAFAKMDGALLSTDAPLTLLRGAIGSNITQIDISNSPTNAIVVSDGARAHLDAVIGSNNTNYGIKLLGSYAVVKRTSNTTIAGNDGYMLVGAVARTYSQVPFTEFELQTLTSGSAATIGVSNEITGLTNAALTDLNVGDKLVISGAVGGNNGTKQIIAVTSATSAIVAQALTSPDANSGSISWVLKSSRTTGNRIE